MASKEFTPKPVIKIPTPPPTSLEDIPTPAPKSYRPPSDAKYRNNRRSLLHPGKMKLNRQASIYGTR